MRGYGLEEWSDEDCSYCPIEAFKNLWHTIHASDSQNGWKANPWVWVIEFKVIEKCEVNK